MLVSRRIVRGWLSGYRKPRLNNLKIAAQLLGVSFREFLHPVEDSTENAIVEQLGEEIEDEDDEK